MLIVTLETLKVFKDLADSGSFSKAAELNCISQSAVSQQIKRLEQMLKCRLFERSSKNLSRTSCGSIFYKACGHIISTYEDMLLSLKSVSAVVEGNVKIITIYSVGTYVIQDYIKRFIKRYPSVSVNIEYRKARQIYSDIATGRADLSIMAYPSRHSGIEIIPLCDEEMILICHPKHPFSGRKRIAIARLAGEDFVSFERVSPTRKSLDVLLRRYKVKVNIKMEMDNIETIKTAVQTGAGISIVPADTVRNEELQEKLCALRFSDVTISRPLCVLIKKDKKFPQAVKSFLQLLNEMVSPLHRT